MVVDVGILDQVTLQFMQALQRDMQIVQTAAKQLFYYLAVIQLSLTAIWMTLAGESLQRFLVRMVQLSFSFGVYFALIEFGGTWIPQILNGFVQLGQQAGVTSLDPSSIINQGCSIAAGIFQGFFGWGLLAHPFVAMVGAAICISILVLYGFIAAGLAISLVKAYILVSTGGLFFAFGGSEFTESMAKKYFNAVIGQGLYLMTLYFLLGVGQHVGSQWAQMTAQAAQHHELMPMFVILAAVIVYYMILQNIPPFIAGLSGVSGFQNHGNSAVGTAISAGASGANLLSKTTQLSGSGIQKFAELGRGAAHLTKSYFQAKGSSTSFSGMKAGFKNVGTHLGSSIGNTVKDMATRQNKHLSMGQKFNSHLANKVKSNIQ